MSHTPCSRAASCSLAATPPITSSSLQWQIDKLHTDSTQLYLSTGSICWCQLWITLQVRNAGNTKCHRSINQQLSCMNNLHVSPCHSFSLMHTHAISVFVVFMAFCNLCQPMSLPELYNLVIPEFGIIHISLKLLDIVEGLFSQFFRRLDDQGFGCVRWRFYLTHFGAACTNREETVTSPSRDFASQ